jgi:tripartite-type tricarboxylate transporter receptor subunit TctC
MTRSGTALSKTSFVFFFLACGLYFIPTLYAQSPFYEGKTIRVIRGGLAGELYDLWARLIANHMGKHIAGNPNVIVQNMPGAGSMIAANYVYNVAKPDGLTIGALNPGIYMDQLLGRKEVQFDWAKFNWIGTPEQTEFLFIIRADNPYKSIDDLRTAAEPSKCGSTGTGSILFQLAKLMEETLGTKLTLITGYQGAPDVDVALERGEVQCRTITTAAFFGREPYLTWGKNGFVRPLMQTGRKRGPSLPDVPTIYELMDRYKTPEAGRRLATLILAQNMIGRPMVTNPGVPAERVKILREGWNKTLKHPELLAEAKKRGWPVGPVAGEELEALAKEVVSQPSEVIQQLKKLLGEQ